MSTPVRAVHGCLLTPLAFTSDAEAFRLHPTRSRSLSRDHTLASSPGLSSTSHQSSPPQIQSSYRAAFSPGAGIPPQTPNHRVMLSIETLLSPDDGGGASPRFHEDTPSPAPFAGAGPAPSARSFAYQRLDEQAQPFLRPAYKDGPQQQQQQQSWESVGQNNLQGMKQSSVDTDNAC